MSTSLEANNDEDCTSDEYIQNGNIEDIENLGNTENSELAITQAIEIVDETERSQTQYAVPYYPERRPIDKELIVTINKLTIFLAILNMPYLFTNFLFYVLRVGFMIFCQYHGVFKGSIYAVNAYTWEVLVSLFFIRPLLLAMWYHYDSYFMLSSECFQIPFELILLLKLKTLRKKITEYDDIIPLASHNNSDVAIAVHMEGG